MDAETGEAADVFRQIARRRMQQEFQRNEYAEAAEPQTMAYYFAEHVFRHWAQAVHWAQAAEPDAVDSV